MRVVPLTPLTKAVTQTLRVFADTIARWWASHEPQGDSACAETQGVLVFAVRADSEMADELRHFLYEVGIVVQLDGKTRPRFP